MNYDRPELLDRLAAEYALGTLRGRARRRFEQLLLTLPSARDALQAWEERLAGLAAAVPPQRPPRRVWQAIEARTAPRARPENAPAAPRGSGQLARLVRPALGFAFGAALTAGLVLGRPDLFTSVEDLARQQQALPQSYVGLLTAADGQPTLLVSSTRHGRRVSVKFLRAVVPPAGQVIQVWAVPKEGAPFPLGVVAPADPPRSASLEMSASAEQLLASVTRLAVSFEAAPVTAAAPSAPQFVLSGFCVKLW
jgi:anti-sigma-K factor RskA